MKAHANQLKPSIACLFESTQVTSESSITLSDGTDITCQAALIDNSSIHTTSCSRVLLGKDARLINATIRVDYGVLLIGPNTVIGSPERRTVIQVFDAVVSIGSQCRILGETLRASAKGKLTFGDWIYMGHKASILCYKQTSIGSHTILDAGVSISDMDHFSLNVDERRTELRHLLQTGKRLRTEGHAEKVAIGSDCWVRHDCIIMPGANLPDDTVLGSGTVVGQRKGCKPDKGGIAETAGLDMPYSVVAHGTKPAALSP